MSYSINIPDYDWSSQVVNLGDNSFVIELRYKARTGRWYLTLKDPMTDDILISEKKIVGEMLVTGLYQIDNLTGAIYCERVYGKGKMKLNSNSDSATPYTTDDEYPSRNNFGRGKEFELMYLTQDEMSLLAIQDFSKVS